MIDELREFGMVLSGPTLGFGTDVTYCFMRMILRGVFDEYPNLKIVMGHLGEALPFLVDRVNRAWMQHHEKPNPEIGPGSKEPAGYYLKKNLWGDHQWQLSAGRICVHPGGHRNGQDSSWGPTSPMRT